VDSGMPRATSTGLPRGMRRRWGWPTMAGPPDFPARTAYGRVEQEEDAPPAEDNRWTTNPASWFNTGPIRPTHAPHLWPWGTSPGRRDRGMRSAPSQEVFEVRPSEPVHNLRSAKHTGGGGRGSKGGVRRGN